jgi:hypothetical protein
VIRLLAGAAGVAITGNLLVLILELGVYAPSEWFNFSVAYLRTGGWGKGSLAQLPLGFNYLLANGFHGFLITEPALGEQFWVLFGEIASWILLVGVFLGVLQGIRKKEAWWLIVLLNLIILCIFFSWWEYNCRDFWVLPYMLMIILLAGAFPKKSNWFLIAPTIIIVTITALGNWNLHLQYFTNPRNDLAGRIARQLAPETQHYKVFVFTVDGSLMERLRMEGVSTSLWGNSSLQDQNILRLKQIYNYISEKGGKLLVDDDVYCQFDESIKPHLGANLQDRISQSFINAGKEIELISTDYREIILWRIL